MAREWPEGFRGDIPKREKDWLGNHMARERPKKVQDHLETIEKDTISLEVSVKYWNSEGEPVDSIEEARK